MIFSKYSWWMGGGGHVKPKQYDSVWKLVLIVELTYLIKYYVSLQVRITKKKREMISAVIVLSTKTN